MWDMVTSVYSAFFCIYLLMKERVSPANCSHLDDIHMTTICDNMNQNNTILMKQDNF